MKMLTHNLKPLRNVTLALSLAAVLPVQADELLSAQHYGDELNRCVAAIRAELGVTDATLLQHRVTGLDKHASRYAFRIETTALTATGEPGEPLASTDCSAGRFDDSTRASVVAGKPPQQLAGR